MEGTAKCLALIYYLTQAICQDTGNLQILHRYIKVGDTEALNSFRPIFLMGFPCKMATRVLYHQYKKQDGALHHRQEGFKRRLSCQTQLCATYHELAKTADQVTLPMYLSWTSKRPLIKYLTLCCSKN